jgi:hypothetical protein
MISHSTVIGKIPNPGMQIFPFPNSRYVTIEVGWPYREYMYIKGRKLFSYNSSPLLPPRPYLPPTTQDEYQSAAAPVPLSMYFCSAVLLFFLAVGAFQAPLLRWQPL